MNKKESKFDEAKVLKAGTVIVWASRAFSRLLTFLVSNNVLPGRMRLGT